MWKMQNVEKYRHVQENARVVRLVYVFVFIYVGMSVDVLICVFCFVYISFSCSFSITFSFQCTFSCSGIVFPMFISFIQISQKYMRLLCYALLAYVLLSVPAVVLFPTRRIFRQSRSIAGCSTNQKSTVLCDLPPRKI